MPECAVDFVGEWEWVRGFLAPLGYRSAVVGGVALAAYGHPRLTLDLDIVTDAGAQDAIVAMMEARGFETLHRSAGYSNHLQSERARGRVDFMYVRGETADRIFGSLRSLSGPRGVSITVPRPEHLIAMKVRAIADSPARGLQDLADIGYLVRLPNVDLIEVRDYFIKAGLEDSSRLAWRNGGMSSNGRSEQSLTAIDLEVGLPTTPDDVKALRRAAAITPSWLTLSSAEFEALVPVDALRTRAPISASAMPFEL